MKSNLIDIIVPVYNTQEYIQQCLTSIATQLTEDIRVYIINDASKDNSLSIINQFARKYNFTVYSKRNNEGLSAARNSGMDISHGDYIIFLDSDDWLQEGCLKFIKESLLSKPDVLIGLIEGIDTENSKRAYIDPKININFNGDILMYILQTKLKIAPAQKYIVSRKFVKKHNLRFENLLHEDQLWSPKILTLAESIKLFPNYFYKYRLRRNSLSTIFSMKLCLDYCKIIKLLYIHSLNVNTNNKKYFLYNRCAYLYNKIIQGLNNLDILEQKTITTELNSINEIMSNIYLFLHNHK